MVSGLPSFEVTPAMVAAGVFVAREHTLGEPLSELAERVFYAMLAEASDEFGRLLKNDSKLGDRVGRNVSGE